MQQDFRELLMVILLSSLKMGLGGIPLSYLLKFNLLKSVFATTLGGCAGSFVFVHTSDWLLKRAAKLKKKNKTPRTKRSFTVKNKMIVRVKIKYGLLGIAAITPLFLSYPVGCIIAMRYFKNKKKVISFLWASTATWSIILSMLKIF
ncbi:MAG: hypothetical protein ACK5JC_10940 [Bacteroidota bacterium]|jgi:hypothetical protein